MSDILVRVGDTVTIPEIGTGVVTFIDTPNIYEHHYQPIQIDLEKPYDNHKHITYRTNLKTLEGMGEDVLVADPLPFDEPDKTKEVAKREKPKGAKQNKLF